MKTIRLYAYLYHNLGDDLMVEILLERYKNYRFYCDCHMPIRNLHLVSYPNFIDKEKLYSKYGRLNHLINILTFYKKKDIFFEWLFRKYEKQCKCSIYIGGSLYIPRAKESIEDRIKRENRKMEQSPLFIIGANFGDEEPAFQEAFRHYFALCGGVSFRDRKSYERFLPLPNIQYAPDVVFNLKTLPAESCEENGLVIISVIDFSKRESLRKFREAYEQLIVEVCKHSVAVGKQPVLVSFCELESDPQAVERIMDALPGDIQKETKRLLYQNNAAEILDAFKKSDFILATRFHAMIMALKLGKPFFSISYNEKIKQVLQDLNCDAYCEVIELPVITAESIYENRKVIDVTEYAKLASNQFAQLDAYLTLLS